MCCRTLLGLTLALWFVVVVIVVLAWGRLPGSGSVIVVCCVARDVVV